MTCRCFGLQTPPSRTTEGVDIQRKSDCLDKKWYYRQPKAQMKVILIAFPFKSFSTPQKRNKGKWKGRETSLSQIWLRTFRRRSMNGSKVVLWEKVPPAWVERSIKLSLRFNIRRCNLLFAPFSSMELPHSSRALRPLFLGGRTVWL